MTYIVSLLIFYLCVHKSLALNTIQLVSSRFCLTMLIPAISLECTHSTFISAIVLISPWVISLIWLQQVAAIVSNWKCQCELWWIAVASRVIIILYMQLLDFQNKNTKCSLTLTSVCHNYSCIMSKWPPLLVTTLVTHGWVSYILNYLISLLEFPA